MHANSRLPSVPLIVNDPYFSIWSPADKLTGAMTTHWTGEVKPLMGHLVVDGKLLRFLGAGAAPAMEQHELTITPTRTCCVMEGEGIELDIVFTTPLLLHDEELMGTPVTYIDIEIVAIDGQSHDVALSLVFDGSICYDGADMPPMLGDAFVHGEIAMAFLGQRRQNVLGHSGDHITIDWGYLYMASSTHVPGPVYDDDEDAPVALSVVHKGRLESIPVKVELAVAYDDVAAINYFGAHRPAWWKRDGATMPECLGDHLRRGRQIKTECRMFDESLLADARELGGDEYAEIVSAAYRHAIAAHKLIADEDGEPVLLSKENDSNGCIGTVDVSYPSTPLFLLHNPKLVYALCRPILKFAELPVWEFEFAPHDVGRYPHAIGQVYGLNRQARDAAQRGWSVKNGEVYPAFYQYPAGTGVYDPRYQMPVEECGNMLIMLCAASRFDESEEADFVIEEHLELLRKWAAYLADVGEDPGEQLCTDDFVGHLAHNVNLSAKAMMGVYAFSEILEGLGKEAEARLYREHATRMAESWLTRCDAGDHTQLVFGELGWSLKYNLAWDVALGFGLFDQELLEREVDAYLERANQYGTPLDSRASYTKSDWLCWAAALTCERDKFVRMIAPLAKYLEETSSRVPFSDWYDTVTGKYEHFIARSVQGGVFMPLLCLKERLILEECDCEDCEDS